MSAPPHVLSVNEEAISYARFERTDSKFRFHEFRRVELKPDCFLAGPLGGTLRDRDSFTLALEELLAKISVPVSEASLVVPEAWLRTVFTEINDLPAKLNERNEVLRWKLRRLVPFRVDDLRVGVAKTPPLPGQEEPLRILLGFAIESLLAQLEAAFSAHGIRIGRISNESLALLAALPSAPDGTLTGVTIVRSDSYSLLLSDEEGLLLYRVKPMLARLDEPKQGMAVRQDLRLTTTFIQAHFPERSLASHWLLSPPAEEAAWQDLLSSALGVSVEPLRAGDLPLAGDLPSVSLREVPPLLGAAAQEVL
ncbi:MAG TPA: hypothetical protein VKA53_09495 [Thermoanaerobaculia bacterium]|nr:hypothetical protein [Thermoanaerobaculia bacterium]